MFFAASNSVSGRENNHRAARPNELEMTMTDFEKAKLPESRWEHVDHSEAYTSASGMISISTLRLKVPGGWIYKTTEWNDVAVWKGDAEQANYPARYNVSVCFVPEREVYQGVFPDAQRGLYINAAIKE
jgi:hypothetical protein